MSMLDAYWFWWTPEPNSGCYLWTGGVIGTKNKRPAIPLPSGTKYAATVFCDEVKGPCPDGLERSHLCNNEMCVNTDHIVYETRSQNLMRRPSEQRKAAANKGGEMAKLLFTKGR